MEGAFASAAGHPDNAAAERELLHLIAGPCRFNSEQAAQSDQASGSVRQRLRQARYTLSL